MHVLMLTPELPERHGTGGAKRHLECVLGLRARGHQVTVASVARRDQEPAVQALQTEGIGTVVAMRPEPQWREGLQTLLRSPRTAGVLATESFLRFQAAAFAAELAPQLRAWLKHDHVDVALIEHDWAMAELAALLPADVPAVGGFHHNALMHRRAAETAHGVRRWFEAREGRLQADDAARLPPAFQAGYACSSIESAQFTELSGLPCSVVPNGADVDALQQIPLAGGEPGHLLFSGSLGYPPNADAALWLATEILPRVQRAVPHAHLTIVGRGAPEAVERLASEHVRVAGFVPELEPLLASAEVYVAGLLSGAGTKLKVVEALAAGRPLVTTPIAAEGIDIEDGVHTLTADGADAFAAATVRLLQDRELATTLATNGRAIAIERYSWDGAVDVLDAQLRELLAQD